MALPATLTYTDAGTVAVDKINAGIEYLPTLQSEIDSHTQTLGIIEGEVTALQGSTASIAQIGRDLTTVEGEVTALQAATSNLTQIGRDLTTVEGEVTALQAQAAGAAQAEDVDARFASVIASAESISEALVATQGNVAALPLSLSLTERPGDSPSFFTTDLASGVSGVPSNGVVATSPFGRVLRIAGVATLAPLGLRAVEVNRLYKLRAVVTRFADTPDPAGAAVVFGIAWYGIDQNLLAGLPVSQLVVVPLTVAMGRQQWQALVSATPGAFQDSANQPLPAVALAPPGAAYMRPFVQIYGQAPITDIEVIEQADVSDGNLINLTLDAFAARLARVEATLNITAAS